jgi:hypothetical protein
MAGKSALFLLAFLALSGLVSPLFLAAQGEEGGLFVLCEGQREAYVSQPDGSLSLLPLNSSSQSEFQPSLGGPHTVQCGKETKTIEVSHAQSRQAAEGQGSQSAMLLAGALAAFAIFMSLSFLFLARHFASRRIEFTKHVSGASAVLSLKSGMALSGIEISDPVGMGHTGKPLSFRIGSLSPGQSWQHEYSLENPGQALPASLFAASKEGRVSLLSRLFIEGKAAMGEARGEKIGSSKTPSSGQALRKLPKAT